MGSLALACAAPVEMGLGAGGRMRQEIYPDPHGVDTWDRSRMGRVFVHVVNSETFHAITGSPPPPSPISARTYTDYGLPWFDLYCEGRGDLDPSAEFARVKSVGELVGGGEEPVHVPSAQVVGLTAGGLAVRDGVWVALRDWAG
jgi:hypothetical protein